MAPEGTGPQLDEDCASDDKGRKAIRAVRKLNPLVIIRSAGRVRLSGKFKEATRYSR